MKGPPLEGVTVVECANLFAGPWTGTLMGDFGAEILKIEHPTHGDGVRHSVHDEQLHWKALGRNKKSIAIDLHYEEGQEIVKELAQEADVFIENFRPGTLENWGIGWETLSEINPNLVMVRTTGFGQTGPYSSRSGFGTLAESMSGFAYLTGESDGPPTLPPFPLADAIAGTFATFATMFALYWRDVNDGEGQFIDVSLFEPIFASLMSSHVVEYSEKGIVRERQGNRAQTYSVPRNTYKTKDDRWVAISAGSDNIARRVLRIVGGEELANDPRYKTMKGRMENIDELDGLLSDWFAEHNREEALRIFNESKAAIAPIYNIEDIFEDPHFEARDTLIEVKDDDLGEVTLPGIVPKLSETPGRVKHTGPKLGEHTLEVLARYSGLSSEEIENFNDNGIIRIQREK